MPGTEMKCLSSFNPHQSSEDCARVADGLSHFPEITSDLGLDLRPA